MSARRLITFCALAAVCCGSVFAADAMARPHREDNHERYEARNERYEARREDRREHGRKYERESYFHKHGHTRLRIPHGHYPAPGECSIWYPDNRHAGHKPKRIRCGTVPPRGAWVLHHPRRHQGYLNIRVYDGPTISIGEFDLRSGAFIRDLGSDNDD